MMEKVGKKYQVLIFEDDIQLASEWKREFDKNDIQVEHVWDVEDAMQLCNKKEFDAIICDIFIKDNSGNLKDEAGITLVNRLRYQLKGAPLWCRTVPILAVTGSPANFGFDILQLIKSMGVSSTLRKPFNPSSLVVKLQELIPQSKTLK